MPYMTETEVSNLHQVIDRLEARLKEAEAVIKPFTHPDLCRTLAGNFEGDESPIFGRGEAVLVLGNFTRAAEFMKGAA